jgi:hypothetical protein
MLSQQRLKELLEYNPENGLLIWVTQRGKGVKKGSVAGTKQNGYIQIKIDGKLYKAHRLAWLYVYKEFPENEIDHINEIKDDNRIVNLRLATKRQNMQNISNPRADNKSGYLGVCWHNRYKKWYAQISINNKKKYLGYFNTAEEASKAYIKAKRLHHKFWEEKVV